MSLAFLFKKTWHPSTLQNSERVWIAEQKDAAEKRRIEELTKQVREEQQVRELEEMQVGDSASGRVLGVVFSRTLCPFPESRRAGLVIVIGVVVCCSMWE